MQDVVRPGDRQEPVCVLWRQLYVELDFDFVFGPDACFSGRLDAEISLLDRGFAGVMTVLQRDLRSDRPCPPKQREISTQRPAILTGGLGGRGSEDDFLMLLAIEDFRAEHRPLHFSALFFGSILVDHASCRAST